MIKTVYGKEFDTGNLDLSFYPQDDECLVIIDVTGMDVTNIQRYLSLVSTNLHLLVDDKQFHIIPIDAPLKESQIKYLPLIDEINTDEFLVIEIVKDGLLWDIITTDEDLVDLTLDRLVIPLPKEIK